MRKDGINPSLVFFDSVLQESHIKKAVKTLQGDSTEDEKLVKYQQLLREINDLLLGSTPQIHLMITFPNTA